MVALKRMMTCVCGIYSTCVLKLYGRSIVVYICCTKSNMENAHPIWCVIEYEDGGIQIVPKSWTEIGIPDTCCWPPRGIFKSDLQYHKAVKPSAYAGKTWPIYGAKILGSYEDFEVAIRKLKKFEVYKDFTTDTEKEKQTRKKRMKKLYASSSDSESEETIVKIKPFPKPQQDKLSQSSKEMESVSQNLKPTLDSNIHGHFENTFQKPDSSTVTLTNNSHQSSTPRSLDNNNHRNFETTLGSLLSDDDIVSNDQQPDLTDISFCTPSHRKRDHGLLNISSINKLSSYPPNKKKETFIPEMSDRDFKERVIRDLSIIKHKIKKLEERNLTTDNCSDNETDVFAGFPLSDADELKTIEIKLLDKTYKSNLLRSLKNIGERKTDDATKIILKQIFSDKLAMTYSWSGGKGKKLFSNLLLSKVIVETVLKTITMSTEPQIIESIKNWLRHAPKRNENSLKTTNLQN